MPLELNLKFPSPDKVVVRYGDEETEAIGFENPITASDKQDIHWYLEIYGTRYTSTPDDERAEKIANQQLKAWGEALFKAVFYQDDKARNLITWFLSKDKKGRLLTVSANHPAVLSLPWELLRPPGGMFLFDDNPSISIRRKLTGMSTWRKPIKLKAKPALHLLFVVSRPSGAGFINPRTDPQAVLNALDDAGVGEQVVVEFLRPATLQALQDRLRNEDLPAVDILHFDGHGVYDPDGHLKERAARSHIPDYAQALLRESAQREADVSTPDNQGYLLFEEADGSTALINAQVLGELLYKQKISLVVLSACQSAALSGDEEDAMGSVSAAMVDTGIPNVLAMTHSVLVVTTEKLFAKFYAGLLRGKAVGAALDAARADLYFDPKRGERYRGEGGRETLTLRLYDWFLPALYQAGGDKALLKTADVVSDPSEEAAPQHNLSALQEAGFWGRAGELWQMERAFVSGTRRISITGFGGQGKTMLAQEAGTWLLRTGLFRRVCFVSYAGFQGVDPLAVAVSTLGTVLQESLIDAEAARQALAKTPTLVILDNLETLTEAETAAQLPALLTAASGWSAAGNSRVILTSRQPDFAHSDYPLSGSHQHWRLELKGLAPNDAIQYFSQLLTLHNEPGVSVKLPHRDAVLRLFEKVSFHPLSIGLLARQLQAQRLVDVDERLDELLVLEPEAAENRELMASLNLSLERLSEETRRWLPRLGVFAGGAMEDVLLRVTGLAKVDDTTEVAEGRKLLEALENGDVLAIARVAGIPLPEDERLPTEIVQQLEALLPSLLENKEQLAQALAGEEQTELSSGANESTWPALKQGLIATGLLESEHLPGRAAPCLRFHPTLAPALWTRLDSAQQQALTEAYRQAYYRLSGQLYHEDSRDPHATRAVAWRELPNLLRAVNLALEVADKDAADFADKVSRFLDYFGLRCDYQALAKRSAAVASQQTGNSRGQYLALSNRGEQLYSAGRYAEAQRLFEQLLEGLGEAVSYEHSLTLGRLGRCYWQQGQPRKAEQAYRQAIAVTDELEDSQSVKRQQGALLTDLADVLVAQGDFVGAREAYEQSEKIAGEIDDNRMAAVANGQLGTLAMIQNDLAEAVRRYQLALSQFQALQEPAMESVAWHQLGMAYQDVEQWEAAEQAYRESAKLKEAQGMFSGVNGVGTTWNQLAQVTASAGKPGEAETWYRKAISAGKKSGNQVGVSNALSNLAGLLMQQNNSQKLTEARQLAEESLAIKQTLDPAAAQIWTTYSILAQIAEAEDKQAEAASYRRQAREAQMGFMGTQHQLRQHRQLIATVIAAKQGNEQATEAGQQHMEAMRQGGRDWTMLANTLEYVLDDTYKPHMLDQQGSMQAVILEAILQGIENPGSLQTLLEEDSPAQQQTTPLSNLDQQNQQLAVVTALAILQPDADENLANLPAQLREGGLSTLADALEQMQGGERDSETLLAGLDEQMQGVVEAVLWLLDDPQRLQAVMQQAYF